MPAGEPGPAGAEPPDPGLQAERTRLAWRRTGLTATVCALLMVRLALGRGGPVPAIAAGATALCWVGLLLVVQRRIATVSAARPGRISRLATATMLSCVGFAVIAIVLIAA